MAPSVGGKQVKSLGDIHELLTRRITESLSLVMFTKERLQEVFDDAVTRGRMTRSDANDLVQSLVTRSRKQTEDLVSDIERFLGRGRDDLSKGRKPSRGRQTSAAISARRKVEKGAAKTSKKRTPAKSSAKQSAKKSTAKRPAAKKKT